MKKRNYTPQELCDAIWRVLCESPEPMTRKEITTAIGRKKSPHILKMIDHLVHTGYLVMWGVIVPPYGEVIYYEAKRDLATPCKPELIPVDNS